MTASKTAFKLGDTEIYAVAHRSGEGLTMLNVHDDEDTAVQAGIANIQVASSSSSTAANASSPSASIVGSTPSIQTGFFPTPALPRL
jgi:hypothetical protein